MYCIAPFSFNWMLECNGFPCYGKYMYHLWLSSGTNSEPPRKETSCLYLPNFDWMPFYDYQFLPNQLEFRLKLAWPCQGTVMTSKTASNTTKLLPPVSRAYLDKELEQVMKHACLID
jgi:hypothetical protein